MVSSPTTAQEFAQHVNTGQKPWDWSWSDSTKEQYFNYLSAEQANQHELDMWRLNNEYNTPKAQMQRMIDAGINPAAAYGQVSSGSSSSAPATHPVQSAHWRDTQDQVAKINTALSAVNTIFSNIDQVIGSARGIQGMYLDYNQSYQQIMRNKVLNSNQDIFNFSPQPGQIKISDNLYTYPGNAVLFPELLQAGKLQQGYDALEINKSNSYWLNEIRQKNLKVDDLLQSVTESVEKGDWKSVFKDAFNLLMINLFRRY